MKSILRLPGRIGFGLFLLMLCIADSLSAQAPVAAFTTPTISGCAPLSVNFTNNSLNAASYQWDFGNGNYSTLTNPQNVYIQPGAYTVRLIAIAANGSRDTLTQTNYITATPGPQLAISVDNYQGCDNFTQFQFTCVTPDATNLNWDFGDGSTSSLLNPVKTYANTGNYNVSLLATNSNGCQTVVAIPQPVQIIATPHASYTVDITSTCNLQQEFHFTSGSVTNDTYTWDFGDGLFSSDIHPDHIFANSGVFSVELKMTNAFGCADSITIPNLVTVFPDNTPIISGNLSGCLPFATTLSSQVVGATSYSWTSSDGQSATTPNFSVTYFPAGLYDISLTVVMPNGCSYTSPDTIAVQVNPKPNAAFTATNTIGCAPLSVQLTNTSVGATNYYWTFGDGGYSFDETPIYSYTQPGVYTITLKAYNQFGCWRTSTVSNVTVTAPEIFASISNTTGCPPLEVDFTNTTLNAVSYLWDFGDGTTSTDSLPTHTYTTLGQYPVRLIAFGSGGCSDTLDFAGGVNVTAQLANYPTPPPISGCAPFSTSFGINDPNITSFAWDFGDGTTSNLAAPSHTYTTPGTYTVSLQVSDGSICGLSYPVYQQITVEGITPVFQVTVDPCPPHTVHFTDTFSDAVSWLWDFGDGTSSTLQNPVHNYATTNNYHVGLTITTAAGCERTFVGFNAVTFTEFNPSFSTSYDPTDPFPTPVTFTPGVGGITSWFWDFGDGSTSTLSNPIHTYQTAGNYIATLTVIANGCTLTVTGNPFALPNGGSNGSGGSNPTSTTIPSTPFISCAPAGISFFRQSPTHQIIQWNFGDGTTSTDINPIKIYTTPGVYNVSYTAITPFGLQTISYPQSINIGGYSADMLLTTSNNCTTFFIATDLANANLFDQVQWIFGTSNPYSGVQVNYQTPLTNSGINIRVLVTDTLGCSSISNQNILMNKPMPFVSYPTTVCRDSVHFEQLANTNGLSFFWQFGDGGTSNLAEPVYQYDSTGSYTIQLQITTADGCVYNNTLTQHIVFATPKLDVIINGNWDGCAPHEIQLISPAPLTYVNFYDNSTFLTNSDTLNLAYADTGTYSGLMMIATATWIASCKDTLQFDPIHVYDAFPDFNFTQDVNCLPLIAEFSDSSFEATSWLWDFGNGITSTDQNPQIVYTSEPSDSVKLVITTQFGCTDSITKPNVLVYELSQTASYIGSCNPLPVTFFAQGNLPGTFEWHLGNGEIITDSSFTYTYTEDGIYAPFVVGITPSGCSDTSWVTPFRVNSITANFVSPSPAACAPSIVEFFDSTGNAVSWNWDFGDNSGSALQNPVKLYDSPGIYSIQLIVTSAFGCSDTLVRPNYITVLGPATSFTISNASGCVGVPLAFHDQSLDAVEWEWNFGEGTSSTDQNPVFMYDEPGSYVITLFSRDTVGCSAFFSSTIPFEVFDRPSAQFTLQSDSGCTPFSPIINNLTPDAISYSWNFGDGSVLLTDSIPQHTYTNAGEYFVELIVQNTLGCYDTLRVDSVRSLLVPIASLSITQGTGCLPLFVEFENTSTSLLNPSYELVFSDTVTVLNPDSTYSFGSPGFYDVDLYIQNSNGCTDSIAYPSSIEVFDSIPPPISPIIRVSVEGLDSIIIEWEENFDIHFSHYSILRRSSGMSNFSELTTIQNSHQLNYYDTQVNTQDSVYCYKIEAVDVCGRKVNVDSLQEHCTINIQAITQPNNLIDINWTPYVGRVPHSYSVMRTEVGTGELLNIGSVDGSTTHFIDSSVVCPVQYKYEILAQELDGILHLESSSDYDLPAIIQNPFIHQYVNIGRSTVVNNSMILTEWSAPDTLLDKITGYGIYRAAEGEPYFLIAELPIDQTYYMDDQVNVNETKYQYQVYARNICKIESGAGVQGDNVVLKVEEFNEVYNQLYWTPYESWGPNGVGFYVIEKQNKNGGWEILKTLPGTEKTYLDENF